jgi:hypothetical protein
MKKFIIAAALASMVATPVLAAAPQQHGRPPVQKVIVKKKVVQQPSYRSWKKGDRFDSRYARNYRQIDYRRRDRQRDPLSPRKTTKRQGHALPFYLRAKNPTPRFACVSVMVNAIDWEECAGCSGQPLRPSP